MPARLTACWLASSLIERLLNAVSVGASLVAVTVTVKVRVTVLFWLWPSFTVTVTVAVPFALATGVKEREPVVLGLVKETVGFGIKPVLLDDAVTVRVWLSFAEPEET